MAESRTSRDSFLVSPEMSCEEYGVVGETSRRPLQDTTDKAKARYGGIRTTMAFLYAVDFKKKGTDKWERVTSKVDGTEILIGCHQRAHIEVEAKQPYYPYEVRFHKRDYPPRKS